MNLNRGYYWIKRKKAVWKIGFVESGKDDVKFLQMLGEDSLTPLSDIDDGDFTAIPIQHPEMSKEMFEQRNDSLFGKRKPMKEIRPLYFVVQPERHDKQIRYVAQDELGTAATEAVRISKCATGKDLYVMEAQPIGKVRDGKMEQL